MSDKPCICDEPEMRWVECPVHLGCDDDCRALRAPETNDEKLAALVHHQEHGWLGGCSHGR